MKYMAVIPARSGSVSVKNKNTRQMGQHPLFVWSMNHAIESSKIDRIVLSTNDETACDIFFKTYVCDSKIQLIRRPDNISTGESASESALIHAVEQQSDRPEFVVMLQPTSPFRFNGLIDKCIDQIEESGADCLLTTTQLYDFFWAERQDSRLPESGYKWYCSNYTRHRKMRQQMKREQFKYFDNGNIYITRTDVLLETNNRLDGKISVYPISQMEAIQIDTEEDFSQCEIIAKGMEQIT